MRRHADPANLFSFLNWNCHVLFQCEKDEETIPSPESHACAEDW